MRAISTLSDWSAFAATDVCAPRPIANATMATGRTTEHLTTIVALLCDLQKPPLGYRLNLYIALVGLLGSVATIVWLLVFSVNEERLIERGRAQLAN